MLCFWTFYSSEKPRFHKQKKYTKNETDFNMDNNNIFIVLFIYFPTESAY